MEDVVMGDVFVPAPSMPDSEEDFDLIEEPEAPEPPDKSYYFNNEIVEALLYEYNEGACIDVAIRNKIMSHASELIIQIIRAHNLAAIYPLKDDSSYWDLFQIAWAQLESTLYKYDARPHCLYCFDFRRPASSIIMNESLQKCIYPILIKKFKKCLRCGNEFIGVGVLDNKRNGHARGKIYYRGTSKVFNLWSQISRTVILAHIKKESRDRKNAPGLQNFLMTKSRQDPLLLERFIGEAKAICKFNDEHIYILSTIEAMHKEDDRAHEGLVSKISEKTGLSRVKIVNFLSLVRAMSFSFSDSPFTGKIERIHEDGNEDDT